MEGIMIIGAFMYFFTFMFTVRMLRLNKGSEDYKGVINLENEEDEEV